MTKLETKLFEPIYMNLFEVKFRNPELGELTCEHLISIKEMPDKKIVLRFEANLRSDNSVAPLDFIDKLVAPTLVTLECYNRQGDNFMRKEYHHSVMTSVVGLEEWDYRSQDSAVLKVEMTYIDSKKVFVTD